MYMGIDVDKHFLTIAEVDEKGELVDKEKIRNCAQAMDKFGREHKGCRIAMKHAAIPCLSTGICLNWILRCT